MSNDQSTRVAQVNRGDSSSRAVRALSTKGSDMEEDWMWWERVRSRALMTIGVKDASLARMYSFLPASWVGDAHEETDFLPIGD